jgi:hypothetical protein
MKKIILLFTIMFANNMFGTSTKPIFTEMTAAEIKATLGTKTHIVTPSFQNPIHSNDLSSSTSPQFNIVSSGRYYLADDLTQEANGASDIVLQITASNVHLDMNKKSITPHVSGSHATGIGIALVKGISNVGIMNGNIYGADSSGNTKLTTAINLTNSGSGTSYSIKLNNLYVTRCGSVGITADTINDLSIENCTVSDITDTAAHARGAFLTSVNNLVIKNCEFNKMTSDTGFGEGLRLASCVDGKIENVSACNNSITTGSSSSPATGLWITGGSNLKFKNVVASNNNSNVAAASGIHVVNTSLCQFENCIANNNNTSTGTSIYAAGFYISGSGTNGRLKNCQASNNNSSATTSNAYGIFISQANTHLENVSANGNNTNANAEAYGFYVNSNDNMLTSCKANKNNNTNGGANSAASAFGMYVVGGNKNTFSSCIANSNTTDATSTVRGVGFYSTSNDDTKFESCTASNNSATATAVSNIAAGFELASDENRSQVIDCKASNNLVGDGSTSAAGARAYGIYFSSTTGADKCQVRNCLLEHNSVSSSGKAFGFYDNDAASTALLIGNIAIGQGKCLGSSLDSSLQWNGNTEPSTGQNFFFKHDGTKSDPRNAIQEVPRENLISLSTAVLKWQNISVYDAS